MLNTLQTIALASCWINLLSPTQPHQYLSKKTPTEYYHWYLKYLRSSRIMHTCFDVFQTVEKMTDRSAAVLRKLMRRWGQKWGRPQVCSTKFLGKTFQYHGGQISVTARKFSLVLQSVFTGRLMAILNYAFMINFLGEIWVHVRCHKSVSMRGPRYCLKMNQSGRDGMKNLQTPHNARVSENYLYCRNITTM